MAASGCAGSESQAGSSASRRARISRGRQAPISSRSRSKREGPSHSAAWNSPVVGSSQATPRLAGPGSIAITQEVSPASSAEASSCVPGVITRTTSRLTTPLAERGSSICSQSATRKP